MRGFEIAGTSGGGYLILDSFSNSKETGFWWFSGFHNIYKILELVVIKKSNLEYSQIWRHSKYKPSAHFQILGNCGDFGYSWFKISFLIFKIFIFWMLSNLAIYKETRIWKKNSQNRHNCFKYESLIKIFFTLIF